MMMRVVPIKRVGKIRYRIIVADIDQTNRNVMTLHKRDLDVVNKNGVL